MAAQAFSVNIFNSRPGRRTRRSARPPHTGPPRALAHRKREYAQQRARAIARAQSPARARLGRRGARGSGALRRRVCGRAPRHRHTHAAAARPSPPRRGATRGIIDALLGRLLVVAPAAADADRDGHREGLQVLLQPRGKPLPGHRPSVGRRRRGANRPRSSRSRRRWRALGRGGKWRRGRPAAWSSGMGAPFLPARATPEAALAGVGGDVDGDTKSPAGRACATSARCGQRGGGPTSSQLSRGSQRRQATPIARLIAGIRSASAMLGGPQGNLALRPQAFRLTKVN